MNAYWCPSVGRFARTQSEAKEIGQGLYEKVEIDTSQQALIDRLNAMLASQDRISGMVDVGRAPAASEELLEEEAPPPPKPVTTTESKFCPTCGRSALGHHWLKQGDIKDAIVEAIGQLDQAWALNTVAEAIEERGVELGLAAVEEA